VNARNGKGEVPLHDAVIRGDVEIIKTLLQNSADVNIVPIKGFVIFLRYVNKQFA